MRVASLVPALAVLIPLALTGCGSSAPDTSASGSAGSDGGTSVPASTPAPPPATGSFAAIAAGQLEQATHTTANCNLDAVDGKPAGSAPLDHASDATFSGWAGDAERKVVPANLKLVLTGSEDFSVEVPTGMPRPDVAKAQGIAAFATSGYSVKASLSGVPAGDYGVTLLYAVPGSAELRCQTQVKLSIK